MMISRWLLAGTLALAVAVGACTTSRQLVLSIGTTAGVPCDVDRIRIVATAAGTTTVDQTLKGERLPVSITLLDDTPSGTVQLDISAYKGDVEVLRTSGPLAFRSRRAVESVLLTPACTPDVPCPLDAAMAAAKMPPDSGGVACAANVARYRATSALDHFVDACQVPGAGQVGMTASAMPVRLAALEPVLLGADFEFYGRPVRQIWVSKDGYLSFTEDSPDPSGGRAPGPLDRDIRHDGAAPPRQSVMAFWDTLSLGPVGICYEIDGDAGGRQLRVTWNHACLTPVCASDDLNFTIALDEGSHDVEITYGTMTAGNMDRARGLTATAGLVDDATGCPADECVLDTGLCKDGTPCGYSQVFSGTRQDSAPSMHFTPVVEP
jgi:hypothetical protein